jgi:hypothetical protein
MHNQASSGVYINVAIRCHTIGSTDTLSAIYLRQHRISAVRRTAIARLLVHRAMAMPFVAA